MEDRVNRRQRWSEMSTRRKVVVVVLAVVQISLALSAWSDLARRPAEQVRGSKRGWVAIIGVNFVGPILYFTRGRLSGPSVH